MNGTGITGSCMVISDEKSSSLYPMLFGVSCALFSLKHDQNQTKITNNMLHGGASLVGLLLSRVQIEEQMKTEKFELLNKLKNAETEIQELKWRRVEDAKANEKVVGIFSAHEQRWLTEKKKLTHQIRALLNELRSTRTESKENAAKWSRELREKDEELEEEKRKRREQEESVKDVEKTNEELRETLKREAREHCKEIWKHKSAFIELVSTQRQLEAEMGRAVRQVEAEKQELDAVLGQKEEYVLMTQKLSIELIETRKDLEQKEKILSAMLRKSKLDSAEKQMLPKEAKTSKSKRQQAGREMEKPRMVPETRYSLRSMLSRHHKPKPEAIAGLKGVSSVVVMPSCTRSQPTNLLEYDQLESQDELDVTSPISQQSVAEASEESADIRKLEGWVQCEAEKYITILEQRHQLEVNAFAEQLRLKDEKLEAFRWHSLSMEIQLKQLHSRIEGLDRDLTNLKEQNFKLEALLSDRESELHALRDQMKPESRHLANATTHNDDDDDDDTVSPNVRIIIRKPCNQEVRCEEERVFKDTLLTVQSPDKEFEECGRKKDVLNAENMASSTWKMDLHALGVFYKIKRLNQQLLMFERLTGKQESCENSDKMQVGAKGLYSLMSLVNKQVRRYQSLQEKANDICKRMHDHNQDASNGGSFAAKSKDATKKLEHFLEETFQLQRYIVATGQKLMEIQSKITSGFDGAPDDDDTTSFDTKKFADCLRTLFREVQRGLEVRISRIIGDLEGPLTWDGMIHPRA